MTTNRELQRTAARVLADLLDTEGLPEVSWNLIAPDRFTDCYAPPHLDTDLLSGQATSHQAVRDWAAHLGTHVDLRHGITPDARTIMDGIVVRIWCAPEYRDDVNASEE